MASDLLLFHRRFLSVAALKDAGNAIESSTHDTSTR